MAAVQYSHAGARAPDSIWRTSLEVRGSSGNERVCTIRVSPRPTANGQPGRLPSSLDISVDPLRSFLVAHFNRVDKRDAHEWKSFLDKHTDARVDVVPSGNNSEAALKRWDRYVQELASGRGQRVYFVIQSLPQTNMPATQSDELALLIEAYLDESGRPNSNSLFGYSACPMFRVPRVKAWIMTHGQLAIVRPGSRPQAPLPLPSLGQAAAAMANPAPSLSAGVPMSASSGASLQGGLTYRSLLTGGQRHGNWAFGAFAELFDNARDEEAKEVHVTLVVPAAACAVGPRPACDHASAELRIRDDGVGMGKQVLKKILTLNGYSTKATAAQRAKAIGKFGEGFKSGAFRLGSSVLVLTKTRGDAVPLGEGGSVALRKVGLVKPCRYSVGMVTLPGKGCNIGSEQFVEPEWNTNAVAYVLSFDESTRALKDMDAPGSKEFQQAREAIFKRSTLHTDEQIAAAFDEIHGESGTLVIISRLRLWGNQLELQVHSGDSGTSAASTSSTASAAAAPSNASPAAAGAWQQLPDIRLPEAAGQMIPGREWTPSVVWMDISLRAYAQVLYRKPIMRIFVQGVAVPAIIAEDALKTLTADPYVCKERGYKLFIGESDAAREQQLKGIMLYHEGDRLISSYEQHVHLDEGFIGVLSTAGIDGVDVANEKQSYQSRKEFHDLLNWISSTCDKFTQLVHNEKRIHRAQGESDWHVLREQWVQCSDCDKWRKFPLSASEQMAAYKDNDQSWKCSMITWNTTLASCDAPEEPYERDETTGPGLNSAAAPASAAAAAATVAPSTPVKMRLSAAHLPLVSSLSVPSVQSPVPPPELQRDDSTDAAAVPAFTSISLAETEFEYSTFQSQLKEDNSCGTGTCAQVYRVGNPLGRGSLALKLVKISSGAEEQHKLLRELRSQRVVQHPNVVRMVGWIREPLCLLTDFVEGCDRESIVFGKGAAAPLDLAPLMRHTLIIDIVESMVELHRQNVVHNDLKPANIVVAGVVQSRPQNDSSTACRPVLQLVDGARPTALLCDFGLAREIKVANQTIMTAQGSIGGTLMYMSPEEAARWWGESDDEDEDEDGEEQQQQRIPSSVQKAADVWSFAVIVVELLSMPQAKLAYTLEGKQKVPAPFGTADAKAAPHTHKSFAKLLRTGCCPHADLTQYNLSVYSDVLRGCFQKDPLQRLSFPEILRMLMAIPLHQVNPASQSPHSLFRVLYHWQWIPHAGLRAPQDTSAITPEIHVSNARKASSESHWLSLSGSISWAAWYWCKRLLFDAAPQEPSSDDTDAKWAFTIELMPLTVQKLEELGAVNPTERFRSNKWSLAEHYAQSADEMLIPRILPLHLFAAVYNFGLSEEGRALLAFSEKRVEKRKSSYCMKPFKDWIDELRDDKALRNRVRDGSFWNDLRKNSKLKRDDWFDPQQLAEMELEEENLQTVSTVAVPAAPAASFPRPSASAPSATEKARLGPGAGQASAAATAAAAPPTSTAALTAAAAAAPAAGSAPFQRRLFQGGKAVARKRARIICSDEDSD